MTKIALDKNFLLWHDRRMNIPLPPDLRAVLTRVMEKGAFDTEREAIAYALRRLDEREEAIAAIQPKIERGIREALADDTVDGPDAIAKLIADIESGARLDD